MDPTAIVAKRWAEEQRRERRAMMYAVVMVLGVLTAIVWGVVALERASCSRSWASSGMRSEWRGFIAGCLVEVKPGAWMPETAVRLLGDQ